jgi:hypothetical protein
MKKNFLTRSMLGLLLFLVSCSVANTDVEKDNNCQVEKLMLSETDYPAGSTFDPSHSPIADEPKESISGSANYHESWAGQIAIKYYSTGRAKEIFNKHKKSIFSVDEYQDAWKKPPALTDIKELLFENYEFACGTDEVLGYRCFMIGQYHQYFVMFRVAVSSDGITHEMFRDLVLKIDDRLSSCVGQ